MAHIPLLVLLSDGSDMSTAGLHNTHSFTFLTNSSKYWSNNVRYIKTAVTTASVLSGIP